MRELFASLFLLCAVGGTVAFDLDTDNGALLFGTAVYKYFYTDVSETSGDAPLTLRMTTLYANALFDATAPFHDTAVGVYSRFERRPLEERTTRNVNIALLYAAYSVLLEIWPGRNKEFAAVLSGVGLEPSTHLTCDLTTPHGIGWAAGKKVAAARLHDGMNAAGDFNGKRGRNFKPFADTTGYAPVNTAYAVKDASRWQPDMQRKGMGLYKIQQFVAPQWGITEPYAYNDPNHWQTPEPVNSNPKNRAQYKKQADEVLEASAGLTEVKMLMVEFFDNKFRSIGGATTAAAFLKGESLIDYLHSDFTTTLSAFDAGIFVWNEKRRWDAVRPFTAINHIYGESTVRAWGGPGQGTVDVKASEWRSLLEEADHPEYPSASACFCHAAAQAARLRWNSDVLGFPVPYAAGSSRVEPGMTPAQDTALFFPTWTDFAQNCAESRIWGGFHFRAAVDASVNACGKFGEMGYHFVNAHVNGSAEANPVREASEPLPQPAFYERTQKKRKSNRSSPTTK